MTNEVLGLFRITNYEQRAYTLLNKHIIRQTGVLDPNWS